jgi:hypothetical protein
MNNVYFIRHNFNDARENKIENEIRGILKKENCIAIHFNYNKILDEEWDNEVYSKDSKFKKAKEIFKNLKNDGGYVYAQYNIDDKITIGKIAPGSKIIYLEEFENKKQKGFEGFKCLRFSEPPKEYNPIELPVLFALRPIQQTIAKLNNTSAEIVRQIFENDKIDNELKYLSPKFQELLVQEWLRSEYSKDLKLKYQLILTGKDFPAVDIIGETFQGKILFGQVTYYKEVDNKNKFEKFKDLSRNSKNKHSIYVMFSREEKKKDDNDIIYISLDKIFNELNADSFYTNFIEKIFNGIR